MTYLTIADGKIEIRADRGASPLAFATAYEAARWLHDHNISKWMESSSMCFGTESGWHRDDAGAELEAELEVLKRAFPKRRYPFVVELTERDHSTILAALRTFTDVRAECGGDLPDDILDIATNGGTHANALTAPQGKEIA